MAAATDGRLQRRDTYWVRRDACVELSNGRRRYDALFSRTGYQTYPRADGSLSVEYRPPEEVFRADSLATLSLCPGVLLHPTANFGTYFGTGAYPVRGTSGDGVHAHTDGIHTAGTLMVWDDQWNAEIESGETGQLSVGYTIIAGPGGIGPDGRIYDVLHTHITGDHHAGVQLGNAGTARVVTDAAANMPPVTRRALADIVAARLDAAPMHFDLGAWTSRLKRDAAQPAPSTPTPETPIMDHAALATAFAAKVTSLGPSATPRAVADAYIEFYGGADDPAVRAACAAIATAQLPAYASTVVAEPVAVSVEVEMADAKAKLDATAKAVADREAKLDAAILEGAEILELARRAIGPTWSPRLDDGAPKTMGAIKREIIAKIDTKRIAKIDAKPETLRAFAIEHHLDECREILDARAGEGNALRDAIAATREDRQRNDPDTNAARLDAIAVKHGGQPQQTST